MCVYVYVCVCVLIHVSLYLSLTHTHTDLFPRPLTYYYASAYMLMASNYMLNGVYKAGEISINPYADKVSNILRTSDVAQPVFLPDIPAAEILQKARHFHSNNDENNPYPRFSMAAGTCVCVCVCVCVTPLSP